MSYSSDLTKERILSSAKAEFLSQGFLGANMRKIAQNAKVTTGAMYNHFKNKELLFEALVGEAAQEFLTLHMQEHDISSQVSSFFEDISKQDFSQSMCILFDYIYDHFDEMYLLICFSNGTKYEKFMEQLIEVEEQSAEMILRSKGVPINESDLFFIHVMSTSCVNNLFEAVRHNLSKEQALSYMERLKNYSYAGWKEILGR